MGKVVLTILRAQWDRVGALTALLLGALALLNGWFGVSGTALSTEQMPYIVSGGLAGLFLLGVAAVLWLSADLRDEWRVLADLDDRLCAIQRHLAAEAAARTAEPLPDGPTAPVSSLVSAR